MTIVSFLEDQSTAITTWRNHQGHPSTVVGVGCDVHLMDENLDIVDTLVNVASSRIVRLVGMNDNASMFYSAADGSLGFVSTNLGPYKIGKSEQCCSPIVEVGETAVDSDIHRSGHLVTVLLNSVSGGSVALIDTQRDAVIGRIPLGQTGTPNGVRIVDSTTVVTASMVCGLFDIRTAQSKSGIPSKVLETSNEFTGRCFTAVESDGNGMVVAGDSSGGLWLWDVRSGSTPVKSVHGHAGAVLGLTLSNGVVGSSGTDGSVSVWKIADPASGPKKKHRKLMLDLGDSAQLKRVAVEGNGAALAVCIEDVVGADRHVSYVTDTGVVVLSHIADWQ